MSNELAEKQKELSSKRKGSGASGPDNRVGTDEPSTALYQLDDKSGPSKAVIWRTFGVVVNAVDGQKSNYAACKACLTVYTFKSGIGTSSLIRQTCDAVDQQQIGSEQGIMNVHFRGKHSRADKQKLTTAIAYFCAVDMRPFAVVTGSGFKAMIQTACQLSIFLRLQIRHADDC